jgi:rod shape-determining protein MreD
VKIVNTLLAILAVLLLQTLVLNHSRWFQYVDLFLLLNIYYALNSPPLPCIAVAITSGLLQDSFSEGIVGMNAFSKTIVAYLLSTLSQRLMIKHPLIITLLVGVGTLVDSIIGSGLHRLFGLQQPVLSHRLLLFTCSINMLFALVAFHIADRIRVRKEYA